LRKELGEHPGANEYIETVPREGYRFVAPVEVVGTANISCPDDLDGGHEPVTLARNSLDVFVGAWMLTQLLPQDVNLLGKVVFFDCCITKPP